MPSEQSDWFIYCAISQKIAEILYGHDKCDATNYTNSRYYHMCPTNRPGNT